MFDFLNMEWEGGRTKANKQYTREDLRFVIYSQRLFLTCDLLRFYMGIFIGRIHNLDE